MPKILRFQEPFRYEALSYRGLDKIQVFVVDESSDSYDYFGFTRVPSELTAGRNLLSLTGTKNLVIGSEIAIEVLDANGNLVPVRTYDHIGDGNERVFSIEIDERVPEGDALITVVGVSKGRVAYDKHRQRDISEQVPPEYSGRWNIRWQKRLNCYPRRRNDSEIVFFPNPDIIVEEIKRPYFKLHYDEDLISSYSNLTNNTASFYTLCSTASLGLQNTSASLKYEVKGGKYYIIADSNPDFGGFSNDMVGGTVFFPTPESPYPSSYAGPYALPLYNELEDGDGQGNLDTSSALTQYTNRGAYHTYIMERISPQQLRVNSPHTTFQGIGRANQREVFHDKFAFSDFRLDWAQSPVSRSNVLASGSNEFNTSYAKITFRDLTPLVGDVTRIKTYIRNDQTVNDYHLVGDNPVFAQELLIQSESLWTRFPAGDFSKFGVSESLATYWTASTNALGTIAGPTLVAFKMDTTSLINPIVESLQIGDSTAISSQALDGTDFWNVDCLTPVVFDADKHYEVSFKSFAVNTNGTTPVIKVYLFGNAIIDSGEKIGKHVGTIQEVATGYSGSREIIQEEDPLDNFKFKGVKFTFKADATEYGYLRFKVEQGLWYIADVSVKPYDQFGYTPHTFETIIPTTKGNVAEKDALDFRFEFYNDDHRKAAHTTELKNIEFDNEYTFTATNIIVTSASIGNFFGATPVGDNDWVRAQSIAGQLANEQPALTESIYHSGSVGIGEFATSTVDYPLHIKKIAGQGNATIKLSSYSSSILHLASDVGGTGTPTSKSAHILFDHNNAATSSIIGYNDQTGRDPGGAVMDGATLGSFVLHERHGKVMSLGVGGYARFHLVTGKSNTFDNQGSHATFIGWKNPLPGSFDYELDVSGSEIIRSGTLYLPNANTEASPPYILGLNATNATVKTTTAQFLAGDEDWYIQSTYITQSRVGGSTGRTVWIGDGSDITGLTPATYIFQVSQSGATSKIRFQGIPSSSLQTFNILVVNPATGDVYTTESAAGSIGGGGGDDEDWHVSGSSSPPTSINDSIFTSGSVQVGWFTNTAGTTHAPTNLAKPALLVRGRIEQDWENAYSAESTIIGLEAAPSYSRFDKVDGDNIGGFGGGYGNTAVGYQAGRGFKFEHTSWNTAIGWKAIGGGTPSSADGDYNIGIGAETLYALNGGNNNVAIGYRALYDLTGTYDNIAIGYHAGYKITSGPRNIMIGRNTGATNLTTGGHNIFLGYNAGANSDANISSSLQIHSSNVATTNPLITGSFSMGTVRINTQLGLNVDPAYRFDIAQDPDDANPVRVLSFNEGGGKNLVWNTTTGIIYFDPDSGHQDGINNMENLQLTNSPGILFSSGSMTFYSSSVTQSTGIFHTQSAIFKMEKDIANDTSFIISGSRDVKLYFSGSGKLGFGTTNPERDFDIRADDFGIRKKTKMAGIRMNADGNFESYNNDTAAQLTGSELIMTYTRGSTNSTQDDDDEDFSDSLEVQQNDVLGSIRWVVNSGSIDERAGGAVASIQTLAAETQVVGAGVVGKMLFQVAGEANSAPITALTMDGPNLLSTFAHAVTFESNLTASGNISSSGTVIAEQLTSTDDITAAGDISATGTIRGKEIHILNTSFKDDIGTDEVYVPWNSTSETVNVANLNTPFIVPCSGRLLKIIYRSNGNNTAATATWRLNQVSEGQPQTGGGLTVLGTATCIGPPNSGSSTVDFTGVSTNEFDANDMILVSIQHDVDVGGEISYFVTAVFEMDYNTLGY